MSNKNKNIQLPTEKLSEAAMQGGIILMAAAATLGMLELPDHQNSKVIVPNQPAFAVAAHGGDDPNNILQREREEVSPHYISYSVVQRTPTRSGRH